MAAAISFDSDWNLRKRNSKMSEMPIVLNYLLGVAQEEEVSNMVRLAALTVLNRLFDMDLDFEVRAHCLKEGIFSTLVMTMDVAFDPNCEPSDYVYVCVAMETLWWLSRLPSHMVQCLISEVLIRRLLLFLDVRNDFFIFPNKMTPMMREMCENRQLIGKVKEVKMGSAPMEYINRHSKGKLKSLYKLPNSMKICSLYDTSQGEDVDLVKFVIQQELAWEGTLETSSSDSWEDILVTKWINGGLFWAQIGEETIKDVCMIQQELNCDLDLQIQHVSTSGDLIVVNAELQGTKSYLRAQVISTLGHGGRMIDVFLIDYGHVLIVPISDVYVIPEQLNALPQKVSICSLDGIQAPPKDKSLSTNAASVLANIVNVGFPYAGETVCELGGLEVLEKLLQVTKDPDLFSTLLQLLGNLGRGKKLATEFAESGIIPFLLEKLKQATSQESGADEVEDKVLEEVLGCLRHIIYRNNELREKFYQCQGIDITLQFLNKRVIVNTALYFSVVKLLKAFVGNALPKEYTTTKTHNMKSKHSPSVVKLLKAFVGNAIPKECTTTKTHNMKSKLSPRDDKEEQDSRPLVTSVKPNSPAKTTKPPHIDVTSSPESQPETNKPGPNFTRTHSDDSPVQRKPDDSSVHYVLGDCVYICDDLKHELFPATSVTDITVSAISKTICGMLNSGRSGTVYFGIDKDGIVFGLELSRDEKDRFRLGVDTLTLNPVLLHSNFEFKAVPVWDKHQQVFVPDLFVIEIHAKAARCVTYTTKEDKCYYRYGSATNSLTRQEIRQIVAVEEEEAYRAEIERLLQLRNSLLQK